MARTTIKLLLLFGLYLLLVGQTNADELVAAGLCAIAAGGLSVVITSITERHFAFHHVPWARLLVSSLQTLATEAIKVGTRLVREVPPHGGIQRRPFAAAGQQPEDNARRGLVTLTTSLAPNTCVLAVLRGRREMLVHRLVPAEPPQDREWPL